MSIPEWCIKRPIRVYMAYLLVVLFGIIALVRLPQELYPPISFPEVSIVTNYLNAAPEEIETLITRPIEEAVGSVGGLKGIRSVSREGTSVVTCSFQWGTHIDFAALSLREKIDLVKDRLPHEAEEPVVIKFNPLDRPVMLLSLSGSLPQTELRDIAQRKIKDVMEKVVGVASASISGGEEREIVVEVDQGRLQAANTSLLQVVDSLRNTNYNYPAGTVTGGMYEFLLRTAGEFKGIKDIRDTVIGVETKEQTEYSMKKRRYMESLDSDESHRTTAEERREQMKPSLEKRMVFLGDLGVIKDTFKQKTSVSRYNGKPNISISIQKQATSNTIRVCNEIRQKLKLIKKELPKDVDINVIYDHSEFIKHAIEGTRDDGLFGAILAFLILFLIIRSISASLIVISALPIAVIVTFLFMYAGHMSLNTMTLGALALGVGMMIDNGVVAVENIYRHRQMGKDPKQAAIDATNEVMSSLIGSTLTNTTVYFPLILFVPGIAGQLFRELSWTTIISHTVALIVAITLTPLLGTYLKIKPGTEHSEDADHVKTIFNTFDRIKQNKLIKKLLLGVAGLFVFSLCLISVLDIELLPKVDQGQFIVRVTMPSGTILDKTNQMVTLIENKTLALKGVKSTAVTIGSDKSRTSEGGVIEILGPNQGQILVNLKKRNSHEIVKQLRDSLSKVNLGAADVEYVIQESEFQFGAGGSAPIVVEIKGYDMTQMQSLVRRVEDQLRTVKGLYNIQNDRGEPHPETKVEIDKEKCALYGISVNEISLTAKIAVDGLVTTQLKEGNKNVDIRVQLRPEDRAELTNINGLLIHSPSLNTNVELSQVAHLDKSMGPTEIKRINQERTVLVTASIERGTSKKNVESAIDRKLNSLSNVPKDFSVHLAGEKAETKDAFAKLMFALFLAVVLVYMIMAAQFESLMQPFLIMFTIPLSLIGVIFGLLVTHTPLSVIVLLGVIVLGGIVVNNGILLVDFANRLMDRGKSEDVAAEAASRVRFRPILMTAATTIVGLIPLALGLGEGAELRSPLARAVMGGLLTSTFLTLFVIPALYVVNERVLHQGHSALLHQVKTNASSVSSSVLNGVKRLISSLFNRFFNKSGKKDLGE